MKVIKIIVKNLSHSFLLPPFIENGKMHSKWKCNRLKMDTLNILQNMLIYFFWQFLMHPSTLRSLSPYPLLMFSYPSLVTRALPFPPPRQSAVAKANSLSWLKHFPLMLWSLSDRSKTVNSYRTISKNLNTSIVTFIWKLLTLQGTILEIESFYYQRLHKTLLQKSIYFMGIKNNNII